MYLEREKMKSFVVSYYLRASTISCTHAHTNTTQSKARERKGNQSNQRKPNINMKKTGNTNHKIKLLEYELGKYRSVIKIRQHKSENTSLETQIGKNNRNIQIEKYTSENTSQKKKIRGILIGKIQFS